MNPWQEIHWQVISDPRYLEGVTYGKPRTGHAEGTVANHLVDLDANLERIKLLLTEDEYWKLKVIIHVHDTFKLWAKRDVAIDDPRSHASLAKDFLSRFTPNEDLLRMVQYHDEGFALWKQWEAKGSYNQARMQNNILTIRDMDLFLIFCMLDGYTPSKDHEKICWWIKEVESLRVCSSKVHAALAEFGLFIS